MNALINSKVLTMTSVELLDQINAFRAMDGQCKVRNNDFILRVEDEISDLPAYESFVSNNQKVRGYQLNKDQCLLIGMRESKTVRKNVLNWLKALTDNSAPKLPQTMAQALQLAADQAFQLEEQAPKVAFVDRFIESTGNKSFREVAKMLKANEREFRTFLYESKVMYQLGGGWTAHANHIDAGRFYVTGGEANGHAYTTCKFTPKGIEYIAGKWVVFKEVSH